jgi:hypothetical protein
MMGKDFRGLGALLEIDSPFYQEKPHTSRVTEGAGW